MDLTRAKERAWTIASSLCPTEAYLDKELRYFGPAPIGKLTGCSAYFHRVAEPLIRSFPEARKSPYLFLAGDDNGDRWAAATGNITGVMKSCWLGIPAADEPRTLRFGEFYRFKGDKIAEIRCLFDIPGLAAQSGISLLPQVRTCDPVPPGPAYAEAIMLGRKADPNDTRLTRKLVEDLVTGCNKLNGSDLASQELDHFWNEDMVWYGPWGVGSTNGLDDFFRNAQGPSVNSFPGRRGTWPKDCFIAEGHLAAFTGWPSLVGRFDGVPFCGIAPTGGTINQTIMDFYVRTGEKLAENWVFIDLIEFAASCGVDLMARMPEESDLPTLGG